MTYFVDQIGYKRDCGDCTMCCQGFLPVQVYEYQATAGNPCHFVEPGGCGGGCKIYENRPHICREYSCAWMTFPVTFPEWMQPSKSDVILTFRQLANNNGGDPFVYLQMKEGYNQVRSNVLNWVIRFASSNGYNLEYQVCGEWYHIGSDDWIQQTSRRIAEVNQVVLRDHVTTGEVSQSP